MTFKCHYCEKEPFELKKFLNDHLAMKHNLEFPCYKCNEAFENQKYLAEHLSCHNGFQKVFPCGHCKDVFLDESSYESHVKARHIKEGIADFKCEDCDISFKSKTLLRKHYELKHKKKFSCYKCNKCFEAEDLLKKHIEKDHLNGGKSYKCDTCSKIFFKRS